MKLREKNSLQDVIFYGLLGGLFAATFLITYVTPSLEGYSTSTAHSQWGLLLLLCLTGLVLVWRKGKLGGAFWPILLLFLLYVAGYVGGGLRWDDVRYLTPPFVFLISASLFFALLIRLRDFDRSIRGVSVWFVFIALASFAVALFVDIGVSFDVDLFRIDGSAPNRWIGWYGSPTRLAPVLALGVLFALALIARAKLWQYKILLLIYVAALLGGVFLTGTRGVILALAPAAMLFYILAATSSTAKVGIVFLGVSFLVAFILVLPEISSTLSILERVDSDDQRLRYLFGGLHFFSSGTLPEIFFGRGYGAFMREFGASAHNGYVRALVDHGSIFLMLKLVFVCLLWINLLYARTLNREWRALIASILCFLLIRDLTSPAMMATRFEGLAFAFVIGVAIAVLRDSFARRPSMV